MNILADRGEDRMLVVDRLSVSYGPIAAVREVSLHVQRGEVVSLLGANGAGKSSLLSAICGLMRPAAGEIKLDGQRIDGLPAETIVRRGLTLVPEGRRVFGRRTVGQNLRLGGVTQSSRADLEAALDRVLSIFPILGERMGDQAGALSGGQQQMLAVGRALMSSPRLLLLDEPSLGLAPMIVDEIFGLFARLVDEGVTILLVEQDVHRALQVSSRAYVLSNGSLEAEGNSEDLLHDSDVERAYLGIGS